MSNKNQLIKLISSRSHRSINDPNYESDMLSMLAQFLLYARTRETFTLKHRIQRNQKRKTILNYDVEVTPIELMKDFLSKKELIENYSIPNNLLILRKFYLQSTKSISFSTFYSSFKGLNDLKFQNRFPNINFASISEILSSIEETITESEIISNYQTILDFYDLYRK
jgi:hypothetical protein